MAMEHECDEDDEVEYDGDNGNSGDADHGPDVDESYEDDDDNVIAILKMTRMKMTITTAARSVRMTTLKKFETARSAAEESFVYVARDSLSDMYGVK